MGMNRKVRLYRVITYCIAFYAALAFLLLGPVGILKSDRMVAGNEVPAGNVEVRLDRQVQQVIVAEGTWLRYLDLYVTSEDSAGKTYNLLVYDSNNERLLQRQLALPETEIPGFVRLPIGVETVPGQLYVWQLQGTDTPLTLAFENTGETGLTAFGNYYVLENGQSFMQEAQNIVMRLTYTDSPSAKKMAALYGGLLAAAGICIALTEYRGRKSQKLKREVRLQTAVRLTAGPVLFGTVLYLCDAVFRRNLFGGQPEDKIVYGLGIGIAAAFFAWAIFAPRRGAAGQPLRELFSESGMDWLQSAAFAGVLWGTIRFMNAQYQFQQDMAYRQVLFASALVLLTMGPAKALLHKYSALWVGLSALAGIIWYGIRKASLPAEEAEQKLSLLRWDIFIAVAAGLVLIALWDKIRRRTFVFSKVNRLYAGLLIVLFALLLIFRNTRTWPIYLLVVFGLFYLFYLGWENRDRLLYDFCNGVTLNFALALIFALARRPFRAWVYSRYNFVFHTVTITATYLTLVLCALTVRLLMKLYKGKRLTDLWGTLLLYGMAMALLFFTLSRTGYLAVVVMTAVILPFVTFVCYRKGIGPFLRYAGCMLLSAVLCLPVAYTGVRILPALYNDPYIYEVEESAAAIHRDDPKDSTGYMSVSYFKYVMDNKLFAEAEAGKLSPRDWMSCLAGKTVVLPGSVLMASAEGSVSEMSDLEGFSNGRLEIFQSYIGNWNLTGHDQMGVTLPDGSTSVHAHNTYLQAIHDHGLITGAVYLIFGVVSAGMMFRYAAKRGREEACAALPLAVFIGFAVAGLVEWIFHPCNPMGYSAMVVLAPLLLSDRKSRSGKVFEK